MSRDSEQGVVIRAIGLSRPDAKTMIGVLRCMDFYSRTKASFIPPGVNPSGWVAGQGS